MDTSDIKRYNARVNDDEKRTFRIEVSQFKRGNSGTLESQGFIFRHGRIETISQPIASGCATARLKQRRVLIVRAADELRVFYPEPKRGDDGEYYPTFELVLTSADRLPSGMQTVCEHCNGRGYKAEK